METIDYLPYIAMVFIAGWALYGFFGPIVKVSDKNEHNGFSVKLRAKNTNGNWGPAVRVQEIGEWKVCKIIGVVAGLLVLALGAILQAPMLMFASMFVAAAADAFTRNLAFLDASGHLAEILYVEEHVVPGLAPGEAKTLKLNRYRMDELSRMTKDRD